MRTAEHPFAQWGIVGHEQVIRVLEYSFLRQKLSHAYLFSGLAHIGKFTIASTLARALLCTNERAMQRPCNTCEQCIASKTGVHPDIITLAREAEEKEIGIERVRNLRFALEHTSFFEGYRVAIIDGVDMLTIEGANALLKTLEEPRGRTIFLLIASNARRVPSTVTSRCVVLHCSPPEHIHIQSLLMDRGMQHDDAERLTVLTRGAIGTAVSLATDAAKRDAFEETLHATVELLNDRMWTDRRKRIEHSIETWIQDDALRLMQTLLHTMLRFAIGERQHAINDLLDGQLSTVAKRGTIQKWLHVLRTFSALVEHLRFTNIQPLLAYEQFLLTLP